MSRRFKLKYDGEILGIYTGNVPKQAANKGFSEIIKQKMKQNVRIDETFKFSLIEIVNRKDGEEFHYVGQHKKLDEPVEMKVGDGVISYNYVNSVKSIHKDNY